MTDTNVSWKKSDLELQMGAEGWRLLTNVPTDYDVIHHGHLRPRKSPKTDVEITTDYLREGIPEVRIRDAYDSRAQPLSASRAVYTRIRPNPLVQTVLGILAEQRN